MERLIGTNPHSSHLDEVQFRRGEYFFTRRRYRDAESAYSGIVKLGASSEFYELGLYKLGWTLYKQEFYEEALQRYIALLDHKVSIGYDFDQRHVEMNRASSQLVNRLFKIPELKGLDVEMAEVKAPTVKKEDPAHVQYGTPGGQRTGLPGGWSHGGCRQGAPGCGYRFFDQL